jgi:prepilin-type N-terminal cleavage/methylation domain-containing protein
MRSGFTVLELCVVLVLMGIGLSVLLPQATRQRDRMAVLSAREATVGHLARTRREARLSGGASLAVRRSGGFLWIESGGFARDTLKLEQTYGVRMEVSAATATIPFDALGVGRVASRSFVFTRGDARAGLVVSAYGRVRRQ